MGASCLIIWGDSTNNMGRVISARVFYGDDLSWGVLSLVRVVRYSYLLTSGDY